LSPWTGGGPSGCVSTDLPMFRSAGGQVLGANTDRRSGASLLPLDFTVKLHRAVRHNDGVYPYYAVFDSTSATIAGWYGVPQSLRLSFAGPGHLADAVTVMNVFQNGIACDDCNPWGFQDPVAPAVLDTPLHQFSLVYLDCDVTFPTNSIDFVSDAGEACPNALEDAVGLGLLETVIVHYGEVERMIDDRRAFQASNVDLVNSPFIAQLVVPKN